MPIPLDDLQIHSEMPVDPYQPRVTQSPLILARDSSRRPPPPLPPPPMALPPCVSSSSTLSLLLSSSPLGVSSQRGFVGESSRNASPDYIQSWCHPRLLVGGWEEDDPRAEPVYKHAGSDLDTCRSIIIVGLAIHDLNSVIQ